MEGIKKRIEHLERAGRIAYAIYRMQARAETALELSESSIPVIRDHWKRRAQSRMRAVLWLESKYQNYMNANLRA